MDTKITKICKKCGLDKDIEEFSYSCNLRKDGVNPRKSKCKSCINIYALERASKEKETLKGKICKKCNQYKDINCYSRGHTVCKPCHAAYKRKRSIEINNYDHRICLGCKIDHPKEDFVHRHNRCKKCASEIRNSAVYKEKRKAYRGRPEVKAREKERRQKNKTRERVVKSKRRKIRRKTDPSFKIQETLRGRFYVTMKGYYKSKSVLKLLGCSVEEFKEYIASKFKPGMTWENWGYGNQKWCLDHIVPISFLIINI